MEVIMDLEIIGTKKWIIDFYHEQLEHYNKVGLGNYTNNDVKVTSTLIECTKRRLRQLSTVYDATSTPRAIKLRRSAKYRQNKEKLSNGQQHINNDGTTASPGVQDNGNTRHERKKS